MDFTNLTQSLSDLHVVTIVWFAAVLTTARVLLIRTPGSALRAVVEVLEAALIAGVLVFMVIQPFLVKAFYIPSGSMLPTLIEDDHILVNRCLYRVQQPHHADVVVFLAPQKALDETPDESTSEHIDYIKRLIGLPGDTIQVIGGTITINNTVYTHDDVRQFFGLTTDATSKDEQHLKFVNDGVEVYDGQNWTKFSLAEVAQKISGTPDANISISPGYVLRNGVKLVEPYIAEDPDYDLKFTAEGDPVLTNPAADAARYHDPASSGQDDAPPAPVPAKQVVVMGDNRNDSNDSSRWGTLEEDRLVGRAVFIFYPFDRVHIIR